MLSAALACWRAHATRAAGSGFDLCAEEPRPDEKMHKPTAWTDRQDRDRDRETGRHGDRETERQTDIGWFIRHVCFVVEASGVFLERF